MAALLGLEAVAVETDAEGRMVPEALDHALATHPKACVVLSMGTTGTGSIDAAATLIPIARRHGARIHADAAYGGFFAVLCGTDHLAVADQTSFKALSNVDSIAIDPHKHGLQPYGCGAILYADLEDVRPFGHDSPYTYYSSAAQHLGQISLECSRAGAAAAALALTFRQLPLVGDGAFARGLAASRRAAVGFAGAVAAHDNLQCFRVPQLDIVVWSHVDERCNTALYEALQAQKEPVYVSQFQIEGKAFPWLRCVFMKPSHADYIDTLMMAIDAALSSLPSK
jgi:glutamate/tyrosine decarboxylase-like PLP-dependent enzyme